MFGGKQEKIAQAVIKYNAFKPFVLVLRYFCVYWDISFQRQNVLVLCPRAPKNPFDCVGKILLFQSVACMVMIFSNVKLKMSFAVL